MLILLGSTGRIGRIVASEAAKAGLTIGKVDRSGTVLVDGTACGNIWDPEFDTGCRLHLADCSIDYSSPEKMVSLEIRKRALIASLAERGQLAAYLTISSGAVEFDDSLIQSDFHLKYKRQKLANEELAKALGNVSYSPRIYTLIGPETFQVKSVGWVNVVERCLSGSSVAIDARNEPRSWVSERLLSQKVADWLRGSLNPIVETPNCGIFHMSEIAAHMQSRLKKRIDVVVAAMDGWLTVPYVTSTVTHPEGIGEVLDLCLTPKMLADADRIV